MNTIQSTLPELVTTRISDYNVNGIKICQLIV